MTHRHSNVSRRRLRSAALVGAGGLIALAALASGLSSSSVAAADTTTVTYASTGEHAFVVPSGVTSIHVVVIGASGQSGNGTEGGAGGDGAMVSADLTVTPGSTLYAEINSGGGIGGTGGDSNFNPDPTGGNGGGESDLRTCSTSTCEPTLDSDSRLLVAGGGGGGAPGVVVVNGAAVQAPLAPAVSTGGAAGQGSTPCVAGSDGSKGLDSTTADQGVGGQCTTGGGGGSSGGGADSSGSPGVLESGGQGGTTSNFGAGGGGAGFFGGGGGAADNDDGTLGSGAGGGGSSCAPCVHTLMADTGGGSPTVQFLSWRTGAHTRARLSAANVVSNAVITAAGGAAPRITISGTPATPTPVPTPPTPAAGSALVSSPWQAILAGSGLLLLVLGLTIGRGRRHGPGEAP